MATENKSSKGAIQKAGGMDFGITTSGAPPAGMERVVAGAELAGYWQAMTGAELHGILRGMAPDAVIENSKGKHGVVVVQLLKPCVVTCGQKQFDQLGEAGQKLWTKIADNKDGKPQYGRRAEAGELVMVSVAEKAKDTLLLPEGETVWLKVGDKVRLPNGNDMYKYECYKEPAKAGSTAAQAERAGAHVPFDN